MTKYKLEYIWLDGYTPVPNLRGKTQLKEFDAFPTLEQLAALGLRRQLDHAGRRPQLGLRAQAGRGLSRRRAHQRRAGDVRSDDAGRQDAAPDQQARHHSRRSRRLVRLRAGIFLLQGRPPARLSGAGYPAPQGPYYTGVGYKNVGDIARKMVEEHLDLCLAAGINHEGINAEVAKGQWEFQIFGKGSKKRRRRNVDGPLSDAAPDREIRRRHRIPLQAARRHRLERLGHALQFLDHLSARNRRQGLFRGADEGVRDAREEHIAVYGPDNHMRLTGKHETAAIDEFSYGIADRGASIRVPHSFVNNGYKGYLEDRRPNSQGDPYQIASQVLKTVASVPTSGAVSAAA